MTHEILTAILTGYIAMMVTYIAFNMMFRR
jgi:hypothetical protein